MQSFCTTLKLWLAKRRGVSSSEDQGNTCLHRAVLQGDLGCVEKLLAQGARVDSCNYWGLRPLDLARCLNRKDCVQLLHSEPELRVAFRPVHSSQTLQLTPSQFEEMTGICYISRPYFRRRRDLMRVLKMCDKIERRELLDQEMLWLGAFFASDIERGTSIAYEIRWVSDEVGYGVFTTEALASGQYVGEYAGEICKRGWLNLFKVNDYCFRYPTTHFFRPAFTINAQREGNYTRYINHSDTPNLECSAVFCKPLFHLAFRTTRAIMAGEQLTYNYGPAYWRHRSGPVNL